MAGNKNNKNIKSLDRFKPKSGKDSQKGTGDFLSRLAKHRAGIAIRVSIVLAVCVLASLIFYFIWLNKFYSSYVVVGEVPFTIHIGSEVRRFGNNILVYNSDGMKCVNGKGEVVWNETFQMQSPMIEISNQMLAVADYNGSMIYIMDENGAVGTINTGIPIHKIKISSSGYVMAVLDDSSTTPIYIYNTAGEKKVFFNTSMDDFGYPLDFSISDNGMLVGVSYLYVDSGTYKTDIAFYNFGGVGQNETDNLVSVYNYSTAVVPQIKFLGNDKVVAVADNRLMFYAGDQKLSSEGEVLLQEEILSVYYGKEYVALVFRNVEGDEKYRIDVYDANGKKKDSIKFSEDFQDIYFDSDRMIVYSSNHCLIHKVGGIDKFDGNFERAVLTVLPTKSTEKYVLVTSDGFQTIELR